MRPSTAFLGLAAAGFLGLGGMLVHAAWAGRPARTEASRALVERLGLTDLCLFTEARYTRNLALADLHAPFQDHPAAREHFPSGSFVQPNLPDAHAPLPAPPAQHP